MSADAAFSMPTEAPTVGREPVTVGAGLVSCSLCGQKVPVVAEMWVDDDEDGDAALVLDSDLRDLELHMAVHEFKGDTDG